MKQWLKCSEPDFTAKAKRVCDLYLEPPDGAVVVSVDEKPMQVLERIHPTHLDRRDGVRRLGQPQHPLRRQGGSVDPVQQRHGHRFHFIYTPKRVSWMNQVEIWFSILHRRVLEYGSFDSPSAHKAQVEGYIRHWNRHERHPFRWT